MKAKCEDRTFNPGAPGNTQRRSEPWWAGARRLAGPTLQLPLATPGSLPRLRVGLSTQPLAFCSLTEIIQACRVGLWVGCAHAGRQRTRCMRHAPPCVLVIVQFNSPVEGIFNRRPPICSFDSELENALRVQPRRQHAARDAYHLAERDDYIDFCIKMLSCESPAPHSPVIDAKVGWQKRTGKTWRSCPWHPFPQAGSGWLREWPKTAGVISQFDNRDDGHGREVYP